MSPSLINQQLWLCWWWNFRYLQLPSSPFPATGHFFAKSCDSVQQEDAAFATSSGDGCVLHEHVLNPRVSSYCWPTKPQPKIRREELCSWHNTSPSCGNTKTSHRNEQEDNTSKHSYWGEGNFCDEGSISAQDWRSRKNQREIHGFENVLQPKWWLPRLGCKEWHLFTAMGVNDT